VTWRELTGVGLLLAGLLAQPLGQAVDRDFRWGAAALCSLGLLSISWERVRRGLGPPSLADLKKDELRDPPNARPDETDWICPHCHERNPQNFAICWKCEHSRPDGAASNNRSKGRDT
jgi:hypothetical protein